MKTQKFNLITFLILIVFSACQKEEEPDLLPTLDYPTVFESLYKTEWNNLNAEFQNINQHNGLVLNKFGFIEGELSIHENDTVNSAFVESITNNLLKSYPKFFGIPPSENLSAENVLAAPKTVNIVIINNKVEVYPEQLNIKEYFKKEDLKVNLEHHFILKQNFLNSQPIFFNQNSINFVFNEKERKIQIEGHWIPDAIVPLKVNYSLADALLIAGKHFSDKVDASYWKNNSSNILYDKGVYVRSYPEKLIVCNCWILGLSLPSTKKDYIIQIDTQTGRIVGTPAIGNWILAEPYR